MSNQDIRYAGFWVRLKAKLIDFLVLLIVGVPLYWIMNRSRTAAIFITIPSPLVGFFYYFYLHARYGQTIGKMMVKIQVRRSNIQTIAWREAFLRSSVELLFAILYTVGMLISLLSMSNNEYLALSRADRYTEMLELMPAFFHATLYLSGIWLASGVIVLLSNRTKRAIHDFIAATVVVYYDSIPKNYRPMSR